MDITHALRNYFRLTLFRTAHRIKMKTSVRPVSYIVQERIGKLTMFGFVQEFIKNENSRTGYQVKILVFGSSGELRVFDAAEEVFQMQFDPHFSFPLIGEYCFFLETDETGVLTALKSAVKSGIAKAAYSFGSPRTVASVMSIGAGYIEFSGLEEQLREGRLV